MSLSLLSAQSIPFVAERRPVAMRNAALSVRNLKRSLRVLETLGVDPSLGASADLMGQVTVFAINVLEVVRRELVVVLVL